MSVRSVFHSVPALGVRRALVLCLLALGVALFNVRGHLDERLALRSIDFKQPYASARCLLEGCDPYSESQTHAAFTRAHGTDDYGVFVPYSALYPPFSLEALTPLAALPYGEAHALWQGLIASLFSIAVLLTAELCLGFGANLPVVVLAAFTAGSTIMLMEGQISGIVISLLVIGFWCLLRRRFFSISVVCLTVALLLKPHDAAIPFLYLLFAGKRWRHVFEVTAGCSILLALAGILWCSSHPASHHWLAELIANVHGNGSVGNVNDPARGSAGAMQSTSLEALVGAVFTHPAVYTAVAYLVSGALLLAWAYPAVRMRNSLEKHVLALASISCLALLPVYHRQYDTRMFLLVFPAAALLWRSSRHRWGLAAVLLLALATFSTAHQVLRLDALSGAITKAGPLATLLRYRPLSETALALTLFFLAAFYRGMFAARRTSSDFAPTAGQSDMFGHGWEAESTS